MRADGAPDRAEPLPLTVGTAGHIDHGKTALVQALTGVDTDRLPEEKRRGITIVLGYAPLRLPGGRQLSLIDVPGHERLVRVMVSGASGIDLYLLVIAADDGVMPQTLEHVRVLQALGVAHGVVAITKSDLADPAGAMAQARELLPTSEIVACSARTRAGVEEVAAALERVAARVPARAGERVVGRGEQPDPGGVGRGERNPIRPSAARLAPGGRERPPDAAARALLHIDRAFTIRGAGTVVTGTLWDGEIARGQRLTLLPSGRIARVRGVQVHDRAVAVALAGQRVAVNLTGVERRAVAPGDVLAGERAGVQPVYRLEAELALEEPLGDRERVQLHHGTRSVPARAVHRGGSRWQLRAERPVIAAPGERLVLRRISPHGTLGGGVIVSVGGARGSQVMPPAHAGDQATEAGATRQQGPGDQLRARGPKPKRQDPQQDTRGLQSAGRGPQPGEQELEPGALALEQRLLAAGAEPPSERELGELARHLPALRAAGRAVRIGRSLYAHPEALAGVQVTVERLIEEEGSVTLARLRDELGTSRKFAQALLEHLDAARVTRRLPDDRRVLRRRVLEARGQRD